MIDGIAQTIRKSMKQKTIFITADDTFTLPTNVKLLKWILLIGGGQAGEAAGGSGAGGNSGKYRIFQNMPIMGGEFLSVTIGTGGAMSLATGTDTILYGEGNNIITSAEGYYVESTTNKFQSGAPADYNTLVIARLGTTINALAANGSQGSGGGGVKVGGAGLGGAGAMQYGGGGSNNSVIFGNGGNGVALIIYEEE
jgi:hypothetical protein